MQTLCLHVPHFKIRPFSVDCGPSPSALSMQTMQPMQPMQPRFVLQQALPRQPAVLSYARPAPPWRVGQEQHQLPTPMKTVMGPMAMPSPTLKAMVKPLVTPPQWVYAAPLLRTPGWSAGQNFVLPFAKPTPGLPTPQLVSVKVTAPERKELPPIDGQVPRDAGVEGMHPVDFKAFWEQSLFKIFKLLSTCLVVPVGFTCMPWVSTLLVLLCFAMFCLSEVLVSSCFVATRLCRIVHSFFGVSKPRNQQNMIAVDLRGEDRACHIRGTVHVPAMDLLKQIQTYVEEFRHQPIVAFFCQYSAHRVPCVPNIGKKGHYRLVPELLHICQGSDNGWMQIIMCILVF